MNVLPQVLHNLIMENERMGELKETFCYSIISDRTVFLIMMYM